MLSKPYINTLHLPPPKKGNNRNKKIKLSQFVFFRWQERSKCPTSSAQVSLCWAPSHHVLYSGSAEGTTHAWDLETMTEKWSAKGHDQIVLDVGVFWFCVCVCMYA